MYAPDFRQRMNKTRETNLKDIIVKILSWKNQKLEVQPRKRSNSSSRAPKLSIPMPSFMKKHSETPDVSQTEKNQSDKSAEKKKKKNEAHGIRVIIVIIVLFSLPNWQRKQNNDYYCHLIFLTRKEVIEGLEVRPSRTASSPAKIEDRGARTWNNFKETEE